MCWVKGFKNKNVWSLNKNQNKMRTARNTSCQCVSVCAIESVCVCVCAFFCCLFILADTRVYFYGFKMIFNPASELRARPCLPPPPCSSRSSSSNIHLPPSRAPIKGQSQWQWQWQAAPQLRLCAVLNRKRMRIACVTWHTSACRRRRRRQWLLQSVKLLAAILAHDVLVLPPLPPACCMRHAAFHTDPHGWGGGFSFQHQQAMHFYLLFSFLSNGKLHNTFAF